ncbi:helix-turn-helix domain-containing protein [Ilumatobacter coccineus]|jgi:DNA-binding transcriptional ArsR family regulator|uniref:Putative ArsR family transcriptional regulator n=1 Tax=Ilumatobacter coccineus (strain NBRC 103263 / KCTC 29153 / YM16-304) TaxID=1313172 RepID=A0A6C7E5N7_ILUCY|nr:helix-turn-helix domain-containing protein [Ilumatobacter coccineus]BAN01452.1 putative ArsR family transcriptional regulator [Ilumatobacter coccineus YM16-304]
MTETRDLLLHPIRLRIVQALVGSPMTPLQLKDRLGDVPQATLYRHINQLADGGLLDVVSERPSRGGVERTYGVVADAVSLSGVDLDTATADEHFRYFATFVGTLLTDFAAYLDHGRPDLGTDRVGYRQVPLWLTDDELDEVVAKMAAVAQEHLDNEPAPGRRRRLLSTIVMPDDRA